MAVLLNWQVVVDRLAYMTKLLNKKLPRPEARYGRATQKPDFEPFGQAQGKFREKFFLDPSHSLGMTAFALTWRTWRSFGGVYPEHSRRAQDGLGARNAWWKTFFDCDK
jgi:hypothetical protein